MAEVNITLKLKLSEINAVAEALEHHRKAQIFNNRAVNATPEEKTEALQKYLQIESILRQLGIEMPDIEIGDEVVVPS